MAFSWSSVTAGVTIALASHINEVRTNTNTLADNLSIAQYSWSELPVSPGDFMKAAQIQEAQDALDYIDNNNVCSAENTVRYTTDNPSFNSGADSGQNATVDSDQNVVYQSTQDTTVNNPKYTAVDNDQHASYLNDQNTGYYNPYYSAVDSDQHASYCGGYNSGVNSGLDSTVRAPYNSSAK